MLPLDSPRWRELHPFFGEPEDVPRVIGEWMLAIGSDQEETVYRRDLFHLFLHQNTISSVAFAVVPWIVEACRTRPPAEFAEYLLDVGRVEFNRLIWGLYYPTGPAGAPPPDWLAVDYRQAIERAGPMVKDAIESGIDNEIRTILWQLQPAILGNGEMARARLASAGDAEE